MQELITIQQKLKAPKNQYNSFGKYHYRSCEDILEAVKPLLKEVKVILVISDKIVCKGDKNYIKATATLYNEDRTTEISVDGWAREAANRKGMDDSQITGATSSYARKYALNGLFLIDDTKDADATNKGDNKKPPESSKSGPQSTNDKTPITEPQGKKLYAMMKAKELNDNECNHFGDMLKKKFGSVNNGKKEVLLKTNINEIFDNFDNLFDEFASQ